MTVKFNRHAANLRTATQGGTVPPKVLAWAADEIERLDAVNGKLVRALLSVEWSGDDEDECPSCHSKLHEGHYQHERPDRRCELDAALSSAGLDTTAKRDEARAEMTKEPA